MNHIKKALKIIINKKAELARGRATVNATVVGSIPTWENEIFNIFISYVIFSFRRSDNEAKRGV